MKITTITFMQTFPTGNFSNQKLAVEVEIEDPHSSTGESNHDAAMDAFKEAKELVNTAFKKMNPGIELTVDYSAIPGHPMNVTQVEKTNEISKEDAIQRLVDQINSCTELKILQSYRLIATGNSALKEAYDNKLKTFE